MRESGSSETRGVADILTTIAENGDDQETDAHLIVCANEIRNAAAFFIKGLKKGGE